MDTPMEDPKEKIRKFISRSIRNAKLTDEDDIFALGYANSMFAMQLVLFVEREFAIAVENEDLDIANFRTVDAIAGLVARKCTPQ
jgi:acyl carrier protein